MINTIKKLPLFAFFLPMSAIIFGLMFGGIIPKEHFTIISVIFMGIWISCFIIKYYIKQEKQSENVK